jgi:hypothetical protein
MQNRVRTLTLSEGSDMKGKDIFRVGLTITPSGLYNIGITNGDWSKGCDFVHTIAPLITDFSERFKDAYQKWVSEKASGKVDAPRDPEAT